MAYWAILCKYCIIFRSKATLGRIVGHIGPMLIRIGPYLGLLDHIESCSVFADSVRILEHIGATLGYMGPHWVYIDEYYIKIWLYWAVLGQTRPMRAHLEPYWVSIASYSAILGDVGLYWLNSQPYWAVFCNIVLYWMDAGSHSFVLAHISVSCPILGHMGSYWATLGRLVHLGLYWVLGAQWTVVGHIGLILDLAILGHIELILRQVGS